MPTATKAPYASAIYASGELDGPEIGTLVVVVDKARNLPNRRTMGKQDPYFNARLGKEAKKTNADRRGGQTPRWDQELRFSVHDSADYYTMKISLFDEGKRTELIGDAWVDLKAIVVPGGGEAEIWQELKCKGKYAGEVRLELTYYDSRPRVEKPAPKKQPSRVFDDGSSPVGSARGRTPVKRRPLPTNPGSVEQPRSFASGPREYGNTASPRSTTTPPISQRRSVYDNDMPRPVQPYELYDHAHYDHEEQGSFVQGHDYQQFHDQNQCLATSLQHEPYVNDHKDQQHDYATSAGDSYSIHLPPLPPMNKNRETSSGRSSRMQQMQDRPGSFSSHAPLEHGQGQQSWTQASYHNQYYEDNYNDADQTADTRAFLRHRYDSAEDQGLQQQMEIYNEPETVHLESCGQDAVAPPPPLHRASVSNESAYDSNSNRTPGTNRGPRDWHNDRSRQGGAYSDSSHRSHRTLADSRARSEMSLVRHGASLDRSAEGRHNSYDNHYDEVPDQRHRSFSEEPEQGYGYDHDSPQSYGRNSAQSSPMRRDMPHTPRSTGSYSHDDYVRSSRGSGDVQYSRDLQDPHFRNNRHQPQQIPMHPQSQSSMSSSSQYSMHARNGSVSQANAYSPTKPHPLSQQQDLLSSSPHSYADDQNAPYMSGEGSMPLIRPLAIAPRKSQPVTPSSAERHSRTQSRQSIPRKSVSPHPGSVDGKPRFSAFSPDSFDVLNPRLSAGDQRTVDPSRPIVDFHGNVIDPSDRLPEASWAPEPTKSVKQPSDDDLPVSTWAPEPDNGRNGSPDPRMITVRTRDMPRGSRNSYVSSHSPLSMSVGKSIHSPPEHRASMMISSPSSMTSPTNSSPTAIPHTRNKLRKMNRPQSMVAMPTSSQEHYSHQHSWTPPPIPAKIPLDNNRSMVRYGDSHHMDRLTYELQNIDIGQGGEPRRIGGRRLLEFGS